MIQEINKTQKILEQMLMDGFDIQFKLDKYTVAMIDNNARCDEWNECIMHLGGKFTKEFRKRYYPEEAFL
jgi:hypothetical protein